MVSREHLLLLLHSRVFHAADLLAEVPLRQAGKVVRDGKEREAERSSRSVLSSVHTHKAGVGGCGGGR